MSKKTMARSRRRKGQAQPWQVAGLGVVLLGLGFVSGYGYRAPSSSNLLAPVVKTPSGVEAPLVKGMRASPDGRLVAFTAIYDNSEHSTVFLLDTKTGKWTREDSPAGWEDTVTQWSPDGKRVLFTREKIPRFAADADAGMYSAEAKMGNQQPELEELQQLTRDRTEVPGERIVGGFWSSSGELVVKARREPKALYEVSGGQLKRLDEAAVTYGQHRASRIQNQLALLVVRDVPGQPRAMALFRTVGGKSQQLTPPLENVVWTYVCEDCNRMIVARSNENADGWVWDLYSIGVQKATLMQKSAISAEVIKVYWSPDGKQILGTGEDRIWVVDLPGLSSHAVGDRKDWQVDDACWLGNTGWVMVAAGGELWKINIRTGEAQQVWKFPPVYWDSKSAN